jgi:hypothetical protein
MMREYPAMTRVRQQMMSGSRGMSQMGQQMAGSAGRRDGRARCPGGPGRPVTIPR